MATKIHFENHKSIILERLKRAKKSVRVAVAWINFEEYFDVFKGLIMGGVSLDIVCSDNASNRKSKVHMDKLLKEGARINLLKMPTGKNHMHHKFCVIDDEIVLNGSFNWSKNAPKNFENLAIIEKEAGVVTQFIDEFQRLTRIDTNTIRAVQANMKCPGEGCMGEVFNLWIFSAGTDKNSVLSGDVIAYCAACGDERVIESCVQDAQIDSLMDLYTGEVDELESEKISRMVSDHLNGYTTSRHVIHAIGRVKRAVDLSGDDDVATEIIWKNKFIGDRIDSVYSGDFGVCYDMES